MNTSLRIARRALLALVFAAALPSLAAAQRDTIAVLGRWDLNVQGDGGVYPSWLEVQPSGLSTLVGRFVSRFGSARAISKVDWTGGTLSFAIPPQWSRGSDLRVEARLEGDRLVGTVTNTDGSRHSFTGTRAPALLRPTPRWGKTIALFDGTDLAGWKSEGGASQWTVVNGVLTSAKSGANIETERRFSDFKLHVEFRYPRGGNSGVYLRGRYEVQIEDSPRRAIPLDEDLGGVYGFLWPNEYAALGPDRWQTYDITLVGRRVTVVLNGHTIICNQIIPGPTGGALDSDEAAPGPILLQGDHTAIEYRNIRITPAR